MVQADSFPTKCRYQAVDTIDISLLEQLHIPPEGIYDSVGNIISLAKAIYDERDAAVISLPFSHTVEAQALGADIQPADETAGPRPGQYVLQNPGQIELLDLTEDPQVANLLEACHLLQTDGYRVAYQISGPISILSCLMDLAVVFKVWRKQPEQMAKIFANLQQMLLAYLDAACRSGVAYLSYADPAGNADILGPKFTRLLTKQFTAPFLLHSQQLIETQGYQTTLLLCPLVAGALAQDGCLSEAADGGKLAVGCLKSGIEQISTGLCISDKQII